MSKCRIVAGALLEGDGEDAADGNAGTWIQLVLMLEEVRGWGLGQTVQGPRIEDRALASDAAYTS